MDERRKFVRIKFLAEVELVFNGEIYKAELLDLSLKGALIRPIDPVAIKNGGLTYLRIQLAAKDELTLEFNAELVHTQDDNLGFKFVSQGLDTMTHLRRLLELNVCDHDRITHELAFLVSA